MSNPYQRELAVALAAVRQACEVCVAVRGRLGHGDLGVMGVLSKSDASPVTVADFASQALICRSLAEAFPNDPVIGEEQAAMLRTDEGAPILQQVLEHVGKMVPGAEGPQVCDWIDRGGRRSAAGRSWTLDPIDGTKGFLRGGQYAVALALMEGGRVQLGVLGCPALNLEDPEQTGSGALLWAVRGDGAFTLSLAGAGAPQPIRTSSITQGSDARLCESVESGHTNHDLSAVLARSVGLSGKPLRVDSQAKYGLVAAGRADIYIRIPRAGYQENIWDHAAGAVLAQVAGGRVTDLDGKELDFSLGANLTANRGVLLTNGPLHERVLEALHSTGSAPGTGR